MDVVTDLDPSLFVLSVPDHRYRDLSHAGHLLRDIRTGSLERLEPFDLFGDIGSPRYFIHPTTINRGRSGLNEEI